MPVAAITFDADQTLWDFHDVYSRALAATVQEIIDRGIASEDVVTADRLQAIRNEIVLEYRGRPHNLEQVREHAFRTFLEQVGHPEPAVVASELTDLYMDIRFRTISLYPEVVDVLGRLGERFRLGLLTNGNTYPDRCGLPNTFDGVVIGPDFGFEKPDPRAYEEIARQLGVAPHDLMHVGDDWDDIEGANAVGATSVFMNRSGEVTDFGADADHIVHDLLGVEALVQGM